MTEAQEQHAANMRARAVVQDMAADALFNPVAQSKLENDLDRAESMGDHARSAIRSAIDAQIDDRPNRLPAGAMPLTNHQHEEYAQAVAAGMNATKAAIQAGYAAAGAHNWGARLRKQSNINNRIIHLRQHYASLGPAMLASRDYLTTQAIGLYRITLKEKQYSVSLGCLQYLGRLGGHIDGPNGSKLRSGPTIDQRSVNIFALELKDLKGLLEQHTKDIPLVERQALLEAAPGIEAGIIAASSPAAESPEPDTSSECTAEPISSEYQANAG